MFRSRKKLGNQGQAIVEFALIIIVLLLIIFFIVEASRILWAWVMVQNAARTGARYGITGQADLSCLADTPPCDDPRITSIQDLVTENLTGLPLNDSGAFEDDYYYIVQIYGVNALGVFQEGYAGLPGQPLAVRVVYNVPIVTPILSDIVENIPVMGQVVVNNELFGQQGNANQGQGLPPSLPPVPTAGPTPSSTPSPTATPTFTPGPPPTSTTNPTATATPTCQTQFEGDVVAGDQFVGITGGLGGPSPITVELLWVVNGNAQPIATGELRDFGPGRACPGHVDVVIPNNFTLTGGMFLVINNLVDNTSDFTFVLAAPPTETAQPTSTSLPTATPTPSQTPTPSATPIGPYIDAIPSCWSPGNPSTTQLIGGNWPTSPAAQSPIVISLRDRLGNSSTLTTIPQGHGGGFSNVIINVASFNPANSPYYFVAQAINGSYAEDRFDVPCLTPPIPTATPTPSPNPADLIIVSYPTLVSTPPIRGYEPVTFSYMITNTGNINVSSEFFVDTYFDPLEVTTSTVPISYSVGYIAVSNLAGGASRVVTMTINTGFPGTGTSHTVVGMVDSILQITEGDEGNNITTPLAIAVTPPAQTPTPVPTPSGDTTIAGIVRIFTGSDWVPQFRAQVYLVQVSGVPTPTVVDQTSSSVTGSYFFTNAIPGVNYSVYACYTLSGASGTVVYSAVRSGINSPNLYVDMFMMESPAGCLVPT